MNIRLLKIFALSAAAAVSFACTSSANAVCFVNDAATGTNDGSSWTNAFTNPQFALLRTDCKEIWVAKGVYKPTFGTTRETSFIVPSGVELYGGFIGKETERDARVPGVNLTVFSGDIDNNDANAGGSSVDESPENIRGDNSYHVLFLNGGAGSIPITGSTVIDGFTITGGNANSTGITADGGGLYCYGPGTGRDDGFDCSPILKNLVFSGNSAAQDGGAVFIDAQNTGSSSPTFISVTFHGNKAGNRGGAVCSLSTDGGVSNPVLNTVFFNANAAPFGGGFYASADRLGGESGHSESNPTLTNVVFSGNAADTGGGMYNYALNGGSSKPSLSIVTFEKNMVNAASASPYGGGMFSLAEGARSVNVPGLTNVTFEGNQAVLGGAIMEGSLSAGEVFLVLRNVTISENVAQVGGGIYSAAHGTSDNVQLTNVILWGNSATTEPTSAEIKNVGTHYAVDHSVVSTGCAADTLTTCINVLTASPKLNPIRENGGYTRTMEPAYGSSAIDTGKDAGCPAFDQRGLARPQGTHCEIGAVEVVPPPPPVADPKSIIVLKNSSKEVAFSASDSNPGGPFTYAYAVATGPTHGLLTVPTDSTIYVPTKDYVGPDSFTYTATDINGTSVPATVSIMVIPLPPPVALPFDVTTPRNTPKSVTLGATDENPGGPFSYTFALVDLPLHGSVALVSDVATYTPSTDYVGLDEFTYTATDVNGTSLPATVTIHVLPVPPPVALPRAIVVPYNTPGTVTFKATDSNAGGPFTYSFAVASSPSHGTLGVVEGDKIVYTPAHNYSGPDSFTYTATDVNGISAPATVTITVLPVGAPPVTGSMTAVPALGTLGTLTLTGLLGGLGMRRNRT